MTKIFRKHKKATLGDPLVDFYSYLAFIVIIIIFFLLFQFRGERRIDQVSGKIFHLDQNHLILGYLKTPVNFEETQMTMMDLITSLEHDLLQMPENNKQICTNKYKTNKKLKEHPKCDLLIEKTKLFLDTVGKGSYMVITYDAIGKLNKPNYKIKEPVLRDNFVDIIINDRLDTYSYNCDSIDLPTHTHKPKPITLWVCKKGAMFGVFYSAEY